MKQLCIIYLMALVFFGDIFAVNAQSKDEEKTLSYAYEQLADPVKERQAFDLMEELRCIQCQGQSIADSDAPIAEAMRHQIRVRIKADVSSKDIKDWLITRYGDYVSFDPPLSGVSILLWGMPFLTFFLAIFFVIPLFRSKEKSIGVN